VDPDAEASAELSGMTGAKAVSLNEALDDKDLAGVVIASATHTHADLIERIAGLGIPIFCEKPLDLSTTRARACVDAVKKHGIPFVLGFNRRYDPDFARLHALVRDGILGNVESVQIISRDPSPPSLDYIRASGGLFRDMAIHDFDMARWLLGEEPDEVSASGSSIVDPAIGEAGDIDTALITLRTPGGRLCSISNSRRTSYGYDQRVEVHGSLRTARVENQSETQLLVSGDEGRTRSGIKHFFHDRYAEAYRMEMRHFVSVIMGNETPRTTVQDGLRALELADAAAQALKEKRTIQIQYVR
jgi:myo-inositol 2-dehydrogenase/D-chiro-inositol 1-dehydrogenase